MTGEPQAPRIEDFVSDMRRMARRFLSSEEEADELARKTLVRAEREIGDRADRRALRLSLVTIMREIAVPEPADHANG